MEMSATVGVLVALPQCIEAAKQLYNLRSRYKDASFTITAIYSESMVVAASLSQIQNLLQHDALQQKPQLLETFDCALTGCRVVYSCLEEEVRHLATKAENDDLKFKDRAKFLWKEDTFKELLTQIRGQQAALNLLIQGLQMESIVDIKKLVEENSVALDQVVKRSRTLRQSHPRVKVPESMFSQQSQAVDEADAESVMKAAEFAFDDEVVNSKAYRRAMATVLSNAQKGDETPKSSEPDIQRDTSIGAESPRQSDDKSNNVDLMQLPSPPPAAEHVLHSADEAKGEHDAQFQIAAAEEHQDLFDTLERDILSFMPRATPTASLSNQSTTIADSFNTSTGPLTPPSLRSYSEGLHAPASEVPPPLPPRRPSGQHVYSEKSAHDTPKARSGSSDDSIYTSDAPSILSKVSTASSYTLECSQMPLPLSHASSYNSLLDARQRQPKINSFNTSLSLHNAEMHNIWRSVLNAEKVFIDRMRKLKMMFYDKIIRQWPILEKHLGAIPVGEQLANFHQRYLFDRIERQLVGNNATLCDPQILEAWVRESRRLYAEYCRKMPHAVSSLRLTQQTDPKFTPFVNTLGLSIAYFGMSWEDYLKLPSVQLQSYVYKLQSLLNITETLDDPAATKEAKGLRQALKAVKWLRTSTSALLEQAQGCEDVQNLGKRIRTDADILSQLRLSDAGRRIKYQGGMALKLKSQGPWVPVHAMLLDNFFIWGKIKKSRGDEVTVVDSPKAVANLELALPSDAHQFQKGTMLDQIPRGSVVYVITIRDKVQDENPSLLGLYGLQERTAWYGHLKAASTLAQK
ncbi:hypothetical protein BDW02DRAFT_636030 [Decorospora gaudefroyi]|uniref:DH domain-containing protein n=1 Tax=Decorospora gaudefroyi TaxID=184978 RepID=A0A6A5KWK8_9PLEO|nr:hypothetical protein BDW02DRAFT_636030 [Decorospora gaudefroyi]